jgi:peroxiredoxin family protein
MGGPVVLLLHGGAWEDRYQAVTLATTAAAYGDPVTVALFFAPLRLWMDDRFDEGAPAEAAPARVAPLRQTLEEARRDLGVRVVACDTALRLAGVDPEAAAPRLDGVESLPALWRAGRAGRVIVF